MVAYEIIKSKIHYNFVGDFFSHKFQKVDTSLLY